MYRAMYRKFPKAEYYCYVLFENLLKDPNCNLSFSWLKCRINIEIFKGLKYPLKEKRTD